MLIVNVDGASKGNPGEAGYGVCITTPEGETVREVAEYIGIATNNVAEYSAFIRGLEEAKSLGTQEVLVLSDSELAVRQINGQYKVKNEALAVLYREVIGLLRHFAKWQVKHIPREMNARADALANIGVKQRAPA